MSAHYKMDGRLRERESPSYFFSVSIFVSTAAAVFVCGIFGGQAEQRLSLSRLSAAASKWTRKMRLKEKESCHLFSAPVNEDGETTIGLKGGVTFR